jgi:hypothetical protein
VVRDAMFAVVIRGEVFRGIADDGSVRAIGAWLGRRFSVVTRELARNRARRRHWPVRSHVPTEARVYSPEPHEAEPGLCLPIPGTEDLSRLWAPLLITVAPVVDDPQAPGICASRRTISKALRRQTTAGLKVEQTRPVRRGATWRVGQAECADRTAPRQVSSNPVSVADPYSRCVRRTGDNINSLPCGPLSEHSNLHLHFQIHPRYVTYIRDTHLCPTSSWSELAGALGIHHGPRGASARTEAASRHSTTQRSNTWQVTS